MAYAYSQEGYPSPAYSGAQLPPPTYHEQAPLFPTERAQNVHHDARQPSEALASSNAQYQPAHPSGEDNEPPTPPPEKPTTAGARPRRHRLSLRDWGWEFVSILLSIACLAAIVVILLSTRNEALSDWHFSIAPNTLVSIFATLTEAAFMVATAACIGQLKWIYFRRSSRRLRDYEYFDDATGPVGALRFIWTINRRAKLALLGSVIALLALAVGAFTQQIISYPSRSVPHPRYADRVTFGRADAYDSGIGLYRAAATDGDGENGVNNTPLVEQVQSSMTGAIMSGLYDIDASVQIACPTGNCTWSPFVTLAISAQCSDVTNSTTKKEPSNDMEVGYIYTLPGNVSIDMTVGVGSAEGVIYTSFDSVTSNGWNSSYNWANSTLLHLAAVNVPVNGSGTTEDNGIPLEWADFEAVECTLGWTARLYQNLSVADGVFEAGAIRDYDLVGVPLEGYPLINHESGNNDDFFANYEFAIAAPDNSSGNTSFHVNPNDHAFIIRQLKNSLNTTSEDDAGKALLSAPNLIERIENITTYMTYLVGQNPNATTVSGVALVQETYIKIDWAWLSFPAGVVLLSVVFFVATLIYSRRHADMAVWKTSSLLPLFTRLSGLDEVEDELEEDRHLLSRESLKQRSRMIMGQLDMTEGPVINCTDAARQSSRQ